MAWRPIPGAGGQTAGTGLPPYRARGLRIIFASVDAHRGAYATGILAMMVRRHAVALTALRGGGSSWPDPARAGHLVLHATGNVPRTGSTVLQRMALFIKDHSCLTASLVP